MNSLWIHLVQILSEDSILVEHYIIQQLLDQLFCKGPGCRSEFFLVHDWTANTYWSDLNFLFFLWLPEVSCVFIFYLLWKLCFKLVIYIERSWTEKNCFCFSIARTVKWKMKVWLNKCQLVDDHRYVLQRCKFLQIPRDQRWGWAGDENGPGSRLLRWRRGGNVEVAEVSLFCLVAQSGTHTGSVSGTGDEVKG